MWFLFSLQNPGTQASLQFYVLFVFSGDSQHCVFPFWRHERAIPEKAQRVTRQDFYLEFGRFQPWFSGAETVAAATAGELNEQSLISS